MPTDSWHRTLATLYERRTGAKGALMNNLTATDVAQTLSLQRRDSSRRFERLPPGSRRAGDGPWRECLWRQKLRTPARVPALQTEVRATSVLVRLSSGWNPPDCESLRETQRRENSG